MFSLIGTAIFGLIVGIIAKFLVPGKDPGGLLVTMLIGVAGAFLGTWLGKLFLGYGENRSAGWIMSIIGAIILLLLYRAIFGRKGTS